MPNPKLIHLREWLPSEHSLTGEEVADLQALPARLTVQPAGDRYLVTPRSIIGAATTPRLRVVIEPKLNIDRVFFMLMYARHVRYMPQITSLAEREGLVEPFVAAFLNVLQRAARRGLPMQYIRREEALPTIRGRVQFAQQFRRRYELPLPIEVAYDDYTVDSEANRLLKAALRRVERMRLRNSLLRKRTAEALGAFDGVTDVEFDPRRLPVFHFTRLDMHYRPVLELAALIVRNTSVELHPGDATTSSILFNMDDVFEDFVFAAIGDELRTLVPASYRWLQGSSVTLDEAASIQPEPDLALWDRHRCVFVGDAKYKSTKEGEVGDLYQLLAYCTAAGLDEGLLLYAEKPLGPARHRVVGGGPHLRVETIDVTAPTDRLLARCREVAVEIASMAPAAHAA